MEGAWVLSVSWFHVQCGLLYVNTGVKDCRALLGVQGIFLDLVGESGSLSWYSCSQCICGQCRYKKLDAGGSQQVLNWLSYCNPSP